jgi:hypothetical protein
MFAFCLQSMKPLITIATVLVLALVQNVSGAVLTPGYTIGNSGQWLTGGLIVDNAATGGSDSSAATGDLGWSAELAGLWTANATVSISGIALPIWSHATNTTNTTLTGTFTFHFYDLDLGTNADAFEGTGVERLLGSATATFTQGAVGTYYANFDSPITFTARSSGVAVRIVNSTWLRLKVESATAAPNVVRKANLDGAAVGGTYPNFRISLAGTVFSPSVFPPRVNLAKYQVVTASTTNGQYLPDFVNDGVVNNNSWRTLDVNTAHSAEVDFPIPVTIRSAHVYSGIDDGSMLGSFKVQYYSYSGSGSWVDAPGSSVSGNTSIERNVIFSSSVTSDRFRLYTDEDGNERVKEFALFPPNPAPVTFTEQGYPIGTDVELNLAKKRPAVASAVASGTNYYAKLAVDGFASSASKWQTSTVGTNTLDVDLRITAKIGSAHLYSGDGSIPPISDFTLQYSPTSTGTITWTDIPGGTVTGNTSGSRVVTFSSTVSAAMVRLTFSNTGTSAVRELCIFPANGGTGYPVGQDVITAPAPNLSWETYNDAFYQITNRSANLSMSMASGNPSLKTADEAPELSHYQLLYNVGTDTYRLRNRSTEQCLAGAGLSTNPGDYLVDQDYTDMPYQNWRKANFDSTDFYLINQWSGLVIDTQGGATAPGTRLVQNTYSGSTSQRWRASLQTRYPRKGMAGFIQNAAAYNGNWGYNWGRTTPYTLPSNFVFNPMQWGNFNWNVPTSGTNPGLEAFMSPWQREDRAMHFLGFNEPDAYGQSGKKLDPNNPTTEDQFSADRSRQEAVRLWPRLERMDTPLVSPVTTGPTKQWMTDFMVDAAALGYRIDAIAAHRYGNPSDGSSDDLVTELQAFNTSWNRPVWLTEFSTVEWSAGTSAQTSGTTQSLNGVWGSSATSVWAVGANGTILKFNGTSWSAQTSGTTQNLNGVWGSSATSVWAVGANGTILKFNGTSWSAQTSGTTQNLNGVWGSDANNVWSVGGGGTRLRTTNGGGSWSSATSGTEPLYSVRGSDVKNVWSVGGGGTILKTTGTTGTWTEEDNYNWLAEFMWRAESLSWLRHYSLFLWSADADDPEPTNPWDTVAPRSNAFQGDGTTPTPFGELYFAWDCDANLRSDKAYFIHNRSERKRLRNAVSSSGPSTGTIREAVNTTQWVLRPSATAGQYYITSLRDGRRLSYNGSALSFAPANSTGTDVKWSLTANQHGWFYVQNPAAPTTNHRLRLSGSTFSMASNTTTTDDVKWRFIVPYSPVDISAPAALTGLAATAGDTQVSLNWNPSGSTDFSFYSVYRSTTSGGSYTLVASNLTSPGYTDTSLQNGMVYYYAVTSTNWLGYESALSSQAAITPVIATPPLSIGITFAGGDVTVSWPSTHLGWVLQKQTGDPSPNWTDVPGSTATTSHSEPVASSSPRTFYRLKHPDP